MFSLKFKDEPHAMGAVSLVRDGCRNRDFSSIIPHQPARYRDRPNEVFLDFEAFLLSSMKERSTLWIHSQIKACMDAADCQPDYCLDMFDQSLNNKSKKFLNFNGIFQIFFEILGHGRKRRTLDANVTDYTRFKENLQYSVLMPGQFSNDVNFESQEQCKSFVLISSLLAGLLALSTVIVRYLNCN